MTFHELFRVQELNTNCFTTNVAAFTENKQQNS